MRRIVAISVILVLLTISLAWSEDLAKPYYHNPAISADGNTVAFVYGGDIFLIPASGGKADLLVSNVGFDTNPRFSPDNNWLAFSSDRTGSGDVYLIHLKTGEIRRLTFHNAGDAVENWGRDSKYVYFSSRRHDVNNRLDIFKVSIDGGTPIPMSRDRYEVEYNAAVSPDGKWLAFNNNDGVQQWWRRGPRIDDEPDIWVKSNDPAATDYKQITTYVGRDRWPMWAADGKGLFFTTDDGSDSGVENIAYQSLDGERKIVTSFTDGRVLWPDIAGNNDIVFEHEFGIWLLKSGNSEATPLDITVISDEKKATTEFKTYSANVSEFAYSPDGKKLAYIVHGEVFATLAKKGEETSPFFRVTKTAARETGLAWTKDSNKLIYASDRNGYRDLYLYDFAKSEETRLTESKETDDNPQISPDGKWLAYWRGSMEIRMINLEDFSDSSFSKDELMQDSMSWSPDSKYLLFCASDTQYFSNLFVKAVGEDSKTKQISFLPHLSSYIPIWSKDGKFVVFNTGQNRLYGTIMRLNLRPEEQKYDEEKFEELFAEKEEKKDKDDEGEKDDEKKADDISTEIVLEGIKDRVFQLASYASNPRLAALSPDGKNILFSSNASGKTILWSASTKSGYGTPAKKIAEGGRFGNVEYTKDGKSIRYISGGKIYKVPAKGGAAKAHATKAEMEIDFNAEKMAAFREGFNALRDGFADGTFNGLDWDAHYKRYQPYLTGVKTMVEFTMLANLWQGDLNASHMGVRYYGSTGGAAVGDLGLDFDPAGLAKGKYIVSDVILEGPVAREKKGIKNGAKLLKVDGVELGVRENLNAILMRKVGKRMKLTFADQEFSVKPVSSRAVNQLRYKAWVRGNAAYVDKISAGRLGYVHIPDMGTGSLEEFKRDLDSEIHGKEGVVVDIRNNNGGWIASFAIDILARKTTHYQTFRGVGRTPSSHMVGNYILDRPTVLLQNEQSLSNAENFSEAYRQLGLGPIVGTNTCGWLIFTSGRTLINGASIRMPSWGNFALDGENMDRVSRKADIFIDRPMGQSLLGKDDQLDKAVEVLLETLK